MSYQERHTQGPASPFIRCFWEFRNSGGECTYEILPDGYFDLLLEIREDRISNIALTGIWTQAICISVPANTRYIGVRFKLLAAEFLFGQSIRDFKDSRTELPGSFLGVRDLPLQDFDAFCSALLERIECRLQHRTEIDARKRQLFEILYEQRGEITVRELSETIHWSSRQINRYFNDWFGCSLKTFGNILKCYSSLPHIASGQLFPQQAYYDQAHFIKEVKRYTGATPKELYRNEDGRFLQLSTRQGS